jgi:aminoglycoside 3-N-acetyltransferase
VNLRAFVSSWQKCFEVYCARILSAFNPFSALFLPEKAVTGIKSLLPTIGGTYLHLEKNVQQISDDLLAAGLCRGGVVMVHASLRAMGTVIGGPETVIRGLLAALGPDGALLMPALSYETVTPTHPIFDVKMTGSNVGVIPEYFRNRADTRRSIHPTHSVCAVGKFSAEMLQNHQLDTTPCGPHSPFHLLPQYHGQILMLGCGLRPNTSMHAIEELVEPPYLYDPPLQYKIILANGVQFEKAYRIHNFKGFEQRYDRVETLLAGADLKSGAVLQAPVWVIEAAALWQAALKALNQNPLFFVEKIGPAQPAICGI